MVCDKDVCEIWCVTNMVCDKGVTEEEAEEATQRRRRGGHGGWRSKNTNPTQFCGEKQEHGPKLWQPTQMQERAQYVGAMHRNPIKPLNPFDPC